MTLGVPVFRGEEGHGTVGAVAICPKSVASVVIRKRCLHVETMRIYE